MTVKNIVLSHLISNGFDGLKHESCDGCGIDCLMDCNEWTGKCIPAKFKTCHGCENGASCESPDQLTGGCYVCA